VQDIAKVVLVARTVCRLSIVRLCKPVVQEFLFSYPLVSNEYEEASKYRKACSDADANQSTLRYAINGGGEGHSDEKDTSNRQADGQ
jgi:hypothetical protein